MTEHVVDRTGWPSGPWDDEPDQLEWQLADPPYWLGLILRNDHGALCGYVGIPPEHPFHGRHWHGDDPIGSLHVHGGVTFTGPYAKDARVWWLVGFDCGHVFDDSPMMMLLAAQVGRRLTHGHYRTVEYVRAEVESLATQLAAVDTLRAMELQPAKEEGSDE